MKRWAFHYQFKYAVVKHAHQTVVVSASSWVAAAAKADREVSKRQGIKGKHRSDIFTRSCCPIKDVPHEDIS